MELLGMLVLGAIIGWLASIVTKRDAEQGWVANILVGIVGAFLGGIISNVLLDRDLSELTLDLTSLFWAFVGSVVLCMILNYVTRKRLV